MSNGPFIQMQGLAAFTARFDAVSAAAQGKAIRAARRAGYSEIKKQIVKTASYDSVSKDNTHSRKNVVIGRSRSRSRSRSGYGREVFTVGIKLSKKNLANGKTVETEGDIWYWKLIEFGTSKMPAQPFMRPAAAAAATAALAAFEKRLGEAITKIERGPP